MGPETIWNDDQPRKLTDVTDDHSQTILLIDFGFSDIDWKEPRDLSFDEAVELLTEQVVPDTYDGHFAEPSMLYKRFYYRNVAMLDGSVRKIRASIPRELAEALLTASGGEEIDLRMLDSLGRAELRYDRVYGLGVFVLLALLPSVPAVRRRVVPELHRRGPSDLVGPPRG